MQINPILLKGSWDEGWALDKHVLSSEYIGDNPFGNPTFRTVRTEIGELVFRLKYRGDLSVLKQIADTASDFIKSTGINKRINIILPAPPSKRRQIQPVFLIAETIAENLGCFYSSEAFINKSSEESKNAHGENVSVEFTKTFKIPCGILLIDDIFNTGATLNACVKGLRKDPLTKGVFVLTMTKAKG